MGKGLEEEHNAKHPVRIWTWKQWDSNTFQWNDSFPFYKHPPTRAPKKTGLSFPAASLCFSCRSPWLTSLWPAQTLDPASSHCPAGPPIQPCAQWQWPADHAFLPRGADAPWAIVWEATLLPYGCPCGTLINSCERLPILANVKRGPEKASQSFSSEVPQPAKQYAIIQCLQFIFLCSSPTVTLERKLICRKIAPASELLLQNVWWPKTLVSVGTYSHRKCKEFWKAVFSFKNRPPHPPSQGDAFFSFYSLLLFLTCVLKLALSLFSSLPSSY